MNDFSVIAHKIDPSLGKRDDGSPADNDRVEIGPTELAFKEWRDLGLQLPNLQNMRKYRFNRVLSLIKERDLGGILLFDPLNIRYATDTSNMQIWIMHNHARACFIGADGHCVLWDFHNCEHLSDYLPNVSEVRKGASFFYFESGDRVEEHAKKFTDEVFDLLKKHGGGKRLAVDKIEMAGAVALRDLGVEFWDGQELMEKARVIKGADDILAMRCAIAACEASMDEMRAAMIPGISENELWSYLHAGNIKRGGEWIETRLLASGRRTNPWFQECGPRIIAEGDLVAFDTDMVGVYGMCCDISRTWVCGDAHPTAEQKKLYRIAYEHIMENMSLLRPGLGFLEYTKIALPLPVAYRPLRYGCFGHGVGLCDEYPVFRYGEDVKSSGYDGVIEVGMTLCVEAYVGEVGGLEGIKLEEQVLITEGGYERLSSYPYEEEWLR